MKTFMKSGLVLSVLVAATHVSAAGLNNNDLIQPMQAQALDAFSTTIPGLVNDHVIIGTAYNSATKEFLNHQPVTGRVTEEYGGVEFNFTYDTDTSYDEILSALNGSIDASVNISAVQVNAGAHIAKESAESEFSSSYTFTASTTPKKKVFVPVNANQGFTLSPVGNAIATDFQGQLVEMAGDEFVTSIEYGAQLFVNMNIEYLNSEDKRDIGGYLGVDIAGGIVSVQGELDFLDEESKESVKITVRAIQKGGDPTQLLNIIPNNIVTCSLSYPQPCFDLFAQAIQYAKNDFRYQFNQLSDYNVVSYKTTRYDRSTADVKRLAPTYQDISFARNQLLFELTDKYKKALVDEQRAADVLSTYYSWIPEAQRASVVQLQKDAYKNAWLFYDAAEYCQSHPYGTECVDYWNNINNVCANTGEGCVVAYDRDSLEIPTQERKVNQCELARQRATNNGLIANSLSLSYRKLRWAPVFVDVTQATDGIIEWTPCEFALTTYGAEFER
ncbi:MAG: internalin [Reinekea sp.]|nr:internalin [Reinekea sp.]